jgi:hypothetical protein
MTKMFDDLEKKYPLLFRENRHEGEGGVICTSCDFRTQEDKIVIQAKFTVLEDLEIDIYFCKSCSTSVRDIIPESNEPNISTEESTRLRAEHLENNGVILECSFCTKDQFDRKHMLSVLRYYRTNKMFGNFDIHPVARDNIFLWTYASEKPEKIAEVYICSHCALGESS